ncbi:Ig-like domain-containing protein [Granulicella sp. 5B5]|uniref:Ig-like domain-containing protein n=1 Tax=Granulicella sp. 5B5 TaxID=1617967 RepID=UPI00210296C3|nr:Ig-like domain-containing protein [Granulicella sp. 5B5]
MNAPSVISTMPVAGATGVPVNQVISATFNESMNPSTISAATFLLTGPGATAVAGTVSYNSAGSVASFAPTTVLTFNTTYTATITSAVTNTVGVQPVASYTWSFTTATQPTVIATLPMNGATFVPTNQILTATFSKVLNPATVNATTFLLKGPGATTVAGTVTYNAAGSAASFTPGTALIPNTVYTATITTSVTDSTGDPLAASYTWSFTTATPPVVLSTVPLNGATGVPLDQAISATFSQAMNCATLASPATSFVLAGPGTTSVAGTVTCSGSVATFTPAAALIVNTIYTATITTGAQSLAGAPLAANYAWMFRTLPAPTPPTVISTVPANLAVDVPINQALSATFSVAMTPATINATSFTLTGPGATPVTGAVVYVVAGSTATFTPSAPLAYNTLYTATITTGAQNLAGTALAQNYVWTFTTGAAVVVPPTVTSTIPAAGATSVPANQAVSATFSVPMNPATINPATFTLTGPGTTPVAGLVAYAAIGNTLTFNPTANLAANTLYTATIATGAQNLAGTGLAQNYVWSFTTGAPIVVPPEIVSTLPLNGATNVPLTQVVSATFTKAMNPLTINNATFQLTQGGNQVAATLAYDAVTFIATLTPTVALLPSTSYIATVTSGATDLAGNPLGTTGAANPWTFMTAATVVPPPVVLGPTISLFGAFGGNAGITNQGLSTVINNGDIGTTAASTLITGFHDDSIVSLTGVAECTYTESTAPQATGLVGSVSPTPGTGLIAIYTAPGTSQPTTACPDEGTATTFATATQAALEAQAAYNTLQGLPPGITLSNDELGNRTLPPGTYTSATFYDITAGPLTLDAQGNTNAYWIFQMGSYLQVGTPTAPQSVVLINGAKASNVFWAVGGLPGAVINYGGGGTMVGTVISSPGITVSSPGVAAVTTIDGRVIALTASVTMVNTVINVQ